MADNDKHNNNDETGKNIASVSLVVRDEVSMLQIMILRMAMKSF